MCTYNDQKRRRRVRRERHRKEGKRFIQRDREKRENDKRKLAYHNYIQTAYNLGSKHNSLICL